MTFSSPSTHFFYNQHFQQQSARIINQSGTNGGSSSVSASCSVFFFFSSGTLMASWKPRSGWTEARRLENNLGKRISCCASNCFARWRSLVSSGPVELANTGTLICLENCRMDFSRTYTKGRITRKLCLLKRDFYLEQNVYIFNKLLPYVIVSFHGL